MKLSTNSRTPKNASARPVVIPPGINFAAPPMATRTPKTANPIANGRSFVGRGPRGFASAIGGGGAWKACSFETLIGLGLLCKDGRKAAVEVSNGWLNNSRDTERVRPGFHSGPGRLMHSLALPAAWLPSSRVRECMRRGVRARLHATPDQCAHTLRSQVGSVFETGSPMVD